MKTFVIAAAMALVASPAMAGTIGGEVRFNGVGADQSDSTEFKLEATDSVLGIFDGGVEATVTQGQDQGPVSSKFAARLGPKLPSILGLKPSAYGEVGVNIAEGSNFKFWGAGAGVSTKVYGPVGLKVGYRHRQGFNTTNVFNEERANAGVTLALSEKNSLGVNYYHYWKEQPCGGQAESDSVGVSFTRKL